MRRRRGDERSFLPTDTKPNIYRATLPDPTLHQVHAWRVLSGFYLHPLHQFLFSLAYVLLRSQELLTVHTKTIRGCREMGELSHHAGD